MKHKAVLPSVLVALALLLWATATPGVFTIDEDNYIATIVGLRDGSLHLPATEGLPASRELLSFDAAPRTRAITSTPVASVAPPLYAVFALPFSYFGFRGLIALQVLAFVVCAWLVHRITRRITGRHDLAFFALGTFALASFSIEYAQGAWPHMLAVALVLGAFELTSHLHEEGRSRRSAIVLAAVAGVCAGVAAGVRYQNIAFAALLGLTLLIWHRRSIVPFVLGLALPLFVSGAMNASRIGSWNPISKGPGYTETNTITHRPERAVAAFTSTYARVVDFTMWPASPPGEQQDILQKNPESGAFLQMGGLKKALLQSAPWALVALLAMALAWRRSASANLDLRRMSLLVAGVLGMFALFGFRHDGLCFNQRYLLELMPLFAIALAVAVAELQVRWVLLAAGAAGGAVLAFVVTRLQPDDVTRHLVVMKVPILIAVATVAGWAIARRPGREHAFAALLGLSLGWAMTIHLREDVAESHALRQLNRTRLDEFAAAVPGDAPAALVAFYGQKDAFGPLTLDRDLVIIDPWIDENASVRALVDSLVARGRTIYAVGPLPRSTIGALSSGYRPTRVEGAPWLFRLEPTRI